MTRRSGGERRLGGRQVGLAVLVLGVAAIYVAPATEAAPGDGAVGLGVRSAVTGGELHTCALTSAGGVKCWGNNGLGQVGDGTTTTRTTPVDVVGLPPDVKSVDAGSNHACAVTAAGAALCWGDGNRGQTGDGGPGPELVPVGVAGLGSGVRAVTAGDFHSCALMQGGAVKCWGLNNRGQLGDGTTVNSPVPVDVAGLGSGVRAISAGTSYTCALTSAGGVMCWGANQNGQLGDGSTTDRSTPVAVAGLAGVSMIDTSTGSTSSSVGSHTCAASQDGTVACWGTNRSGQLGDGTTTSRPTPAPVVGLPAGVQAVATGSRHSCALTGTGAVWCWGEDNLGQLGVGRPTLAPRTVPVEVTSLAVAGAELTAGSFHTCALDRRGGLACWGANVAGQVGDGATEFFRFTPIEVSGSFHRPECVTLSPAPHTTFTLTNGYALGSRATFAANSGYMLTGPADLRCQPDGTWTGPEPPAVGTGRVTVTPNTGLVDRQVVTVTLTGWPALGTVPWCQGIQHTPADIGDCGNNRLMFSTADATGTVVTTFSVDRVMSVPTLGRTVDCAVEPICVIAATDIQDIVGSVRYAPLSFAPPP